MSFIELKNIYLKKMKFSYILIISFLFTNIISKKRKIEDEYNDRDRYPDDNIPERDMSRDDRYYQDKIKKFIYKYGFGKQPSIDKDDYKKAYMMAFRQNFDDYTNEKMSRRDYDSEYMKNFIEQIYYKLMEGVDDEIPMDEALGLYEPTKILNAANEVLTGLGYPNLVEQITNEVVEGDKKSKEKKKKKDKKKKRDEEDDDRIFDL